MCDASDNIGTSPYAARADHVHPLEIGVGTVVEAGSFPTDEEEIVQPQETLWEIGGNNGAEVMVLYKGDRDEWGHKTYGAKLTFSKNGLLTKIESVANSGMYL